MEEGTTAMTIYWVIGILAGYGILHGFRARKKRIILDASMESLRHFAGRAREMQDLWYEETGDPFIMVGGDGNILSLNPAARRLVGAPVEPVAGRPLAAFLKPECEVLTSVQGALKDGQPVKRRAVKVRPVRTAEASREMTIRVIEAAGRRETWVLLGMGGA